MYEAQHTRKCVSCVTSACMEMLTTERVSLHDCVTDVSHALLRQRIHKIQSRAHTNTQRETPRSTFAFPDYSMLHLSLAMPCVHRVISNVG